MVIHASQVHNEEVTKVPNALPGHDSTEIEVYGMDNIPQEDYQAHIDKVLGTDSSKKRHLETEQQSLEVGQNFSNSSGILTTGQAPNSTVIPPGRPPAPAPLYSTVSLVNPLNPITARPNTVYQTPPVMPPRYPMVPNMYRPPVAPYYRPQMGFQNGSVPPRPNITPYIPNWQKGNTMNMTGPPNLSTYPGAPGLSNVRPPMGGIPPNPNLNSNTNPGIPGYSLPKPSTIIGNIPPSLQPSNLTSTLTTITTTTTTVKTTTTTNTGSKQEESTLSTTSSLLKTTESIKPETLSNNQLVSSTITTTATNSTALKDNENINEINKANKIDSTSTSKPSLSINNSTNATVQVISSNKISEFILVYSDNDVSVEEKRANHIKYRYEP